MSLLDTNSQPKSDIVEALNFDPVTLMNNLAPAVQNSVQYLHYSETAMTTVQFDNHSSLLNLDHMRQLPVLDEMPRNEWNFDMNMNSDSGNKSSWLYSAQLNKVYVKIGAPLNVYPCHTSIAPGRDLFIRAMIVFTSQNDLPEPVKKCPNHKESSSHNALHILNCENPGADYIGTENGKLFGEKLAVKIPLRNLASNEPLKLKFTCQNSCSGGMNRKSTSLIFTLEDAMETILGRRVMHFKVCSCPRRDKEKDESTIKMPLTKKRKLDSGSAAASTSKRIHLVTKQESSESLLDESVTELPVPLVSNTTTTTNISGTLVSIKQEQEIKCELTVILPNEHVKREALKAVYNAVAGEMTRTGNVEYNSYLMDIQKQIGK